MKQIKPIMLLLMAAIAFTATKAQLVPAVREDTKIDSFKVWGNCGMCKRTIEKAAKADGVEKAEWNPETKIFTLVYNPAVITNKKIQKAIAASGYDTEKFAGDDKAYEKLPGCCQYERKKTEANKNDNHQY